MRILVLSNEVWNDKLNGNNVTTNWFEGMDATFANIYASSGKPFNKCCNRYFQITDAMMIKSIVSLSKAGKELRIDESEHGWESNVKKEPEKIYLLLKAICGDFLRFVRELIWLVGRYDKEGIKEFIEDFKPDVIFSERMATCKMLRLEKVIVSLTETPMVAFTGDDEYSLRQFKASPFFWINRIMTRRRLRKMVKHYKIYYTLSSEQKEDYEKRFGCNMKILQKCGEYEHVSSKEVVNYPVRIIYAGKLYCNRWKVLANIAECLRKINENEVKAYLEIYTRDNINKKQEKLLNDGRSSFIRGGCSQEELADIYRNSDVALHVESQDIKNKYVTRLSFSTKIIDCIFSGCAILAYCWNEHSGWTYLKRENAALCVSNSADLKKVLEELCKNPKLVEEYSKRAYECGKKNHLKKDVQNDLLCDLKQIAKKSR